MVLHSSLSFFFNDPASPDIYTLSLHDALPICWIAGTGRYMYDDEGKPIRLLGIVSDVTERRRLEQRVRQAQKLDALDRKSTRLNSSHVEISYAVFCLKKKN